MIALELEEIDEGDTFDPEQQQKQLEQQAYREASQKCLRVFNASLAQILGRMPDRPTGAMRDVAVDAWTVAYAIGSFLCSGVSMTDRAALLGVERATLSANVVRFAIGNGLSPSEYMRDAATMKSYMEARMESIERENARHDAK